MNTYTQVKLILFVLVIILPACSRDWKNKYEKTWPMNLTYSVVRKNNKSGVVETKTGKLVLPVEYNMVDDITDTIFIVEQKYRGYISHKGKWIIPMKYNYIWFEAPDRGIVEINGLYGVVDFKGNTIIEPKYFTLDRVSRRCFVAEDNGGWGVLDRDGNIIIPLKYDEMHPADGGVFSTKLGNKWGLIDWDGKVVISFQYDYIFSFHEDLARVNRLDKNGKVFYGYINPANQLVIDYLYDWADDFKDGRAQVSLNNKRGYIDKTGRSVVPFQ